MPDGGIIFRADGSHTLGMGHIVRCLSLATALKTGLESRHLDLPIFFVTKEDPASASVLAQSLFAENVRLIPDGRDSFESFHSIVEVLDPVVIITDIDLRGCVDDYLSILPSDCIRVSLHEHNYGILSGDIVVAPTVRPLDIAPCGIPSVTHFIGAEYILLAPVISTLRVASPKITYILERGFISFGGADPEGLTTCLLDYLSANTIVDIKWDVVLGPASGLSASSFSTEFQNAFNFHEGIQLGREGYLELLNNADLVITNGGTTLYESLALGRPSVSIAQNEFEDAVIKQLMSLGAIEGTLQAIDVLLQNPDTRIALAERGASLVDGKGCARVTELILSSL
jgi:UDP-2,4-diacetamido-2,4,6-trideoxy-beta-L-altropyranose hydrolase